MVRLTVLFYILFIMQNLFAQTISVSASTDTTDYLVGDYIHYTIEVTTKKNIEVFPPSVADSLKNIELISFNKPEVNEKENLKTILFRYVFSGYDSLHATIPGIPVEYRTAGDTAVKKIITAPVSFTIHLVPVNLKQDIKDVKKPLTIPFDWKWLLMWILIGLVVLAAAYYLYRRYKLKKLQVVPEKRIIKIPPHVRAFSALDELEREQLWQKGKIKEYHSRITEIIRTYFEERFNLPAMEMTTTEVLKHLQAVDKAGNIIELTRDFLNNADLVKFAKFIPMDSVNAEMMEQAKEIVKRTIPKETEVKAEEEVNV